MTVAAGTYPIIVGLGGYRYSNGGDSSAFGLTAFGGGAGGYSDDQPAMGGGCGGGGHQPSCSVTCYEEGGSGSQGGDGGDGAHYNGAAMNVNAPGGGGGAGGDGYIGDRDYDDGFWYGEAGRGGPGVTRAITGTSVLYARGGSGKDYYNRPYNIGGDTIGGGASGHDDQDRGKKGAVIVRVKLDG
jgi:hypothetical protein